MDRVLSGRHRHYGSPGSGHSRSDSSSIRNGPEKDSSDGPQGGINLGRSRIPASASVDQDWPGSKKSRIRLCSLFASPATCLSLVPISTIGRLATTTSFASTRSRFRGKTKRKRRREKEKTMTVCIAALCERKTLVGHRSLYIT